MLQEWCIELKCEFNKKFFAPKNKHNTILERKSKQ